MAKVWIPLCRLRNGHAVSGRSGTGGVVEGVKTNGGKLVIESNGKLVHKNSGAANPAVHVARQPDNDVVKPASELTKLQSAAEPPGDEGSGGAEEKGGEQKGRKGEREEREGDRREADELARQQSAGTKRDHVDDRPELEPGQAHAHAHAHAHEEREQAGATAGREPKKPKLDQDAGDSNPAECSEATAVPKRKVGRPKRSATAATAKKEVMLNQDTPATRTRSRSS